MVRGSDRVNSSLQRRLSFWIAVATTCVGIIAAACSFYLSFREARELQDEQLRQTALLMERSGGVFPFWAELGRKIVGKEPGFKNNCCSPPIRMRLPRGRIMGGVCPLSERM